MYLEFSMTSLSNIMINEIQITNYKSIAETTIKLSKFTLLIGANGAGKSNFLNLLKNLSKLNSMKFSSDYSFPLHVNLISEKQEFIIKIDNGNEYLIKLSKNSPTVIPDLSNVAVFH